MQPSEGLHLSSVQGLPSSQLGGGPPAQLPALQVSVVVQALPSSHEEVLLECWHPLAGSHESSVHSLLSSQSGAGPPTQIPSAQRSDVVQALPSSQPLVLKPVTGQVPAPSQVVLSVHGFPSSHDVSADSNWQVDEQQSPLAVLPSSHASPVSTIPFPQTGPTGSNVALATPLSSAL